MYVPAIYAAQVNLLAEQILYGADACAEYERGKVDYIRKHIPSSSRTPLSSSR